MEINEEFGSSTDDGSKKFWKNKFPNCTKILNNHSSTTTTTALPSDSDVLNLMDADDDNDDSSSKKYINGDFIKVSNSSSPAQVNGRYSSTTTPTPPPPKIDLLCKLSPSVSIAATEVCGNNKEDFYEEDIIEGFSFRCFENNDLLEECVRIEEEKTKPPPVLAVAEEVPVKKEKKKVKRNKENLLGCKRLEMNDEKTTTVDDVGALKSIIDQNGDKQRCDEEIANLTTPMDLAKNTTAISSVNQQISHYPNNHVNDSSATTTTTEKKKTICCANDDEEIVKNNTEFNNTVVVNCLPPDLTLNNNNCTVSNKPMAVKHKLDDGKNDQINSHAVKMPKLDCENDIKSPSSTTLTRSVSPLNTNRSLVNGTPGGMHIKNFKSSSDVSETKLVSPKRETSSRSGAGAGFSDGTGGVGEGGGCLPVTPTTTTINGVHQSSTSSSSSSSDLEQRLLIASKGSVFPGLLTPGVSCATPSGAYYHTEMHQHQHTHMHQYPPFLPPFGGTLPVSAASMFGLPSYQALPGLPVPPLATPLSGLSSTMPNMQLHQHKKKGRWCAMHVQIAWDIHNRTKSKKEKKSSSDDVSTSCNSESNADTSTVGPSCHASTSTSTSVTASSAHNANSSSGHRSNHANSSSSIHMSTTKHEGNSSTGDHHNSGLSALAENSKHRSTSSNNEKEKLTNNRSESRASVASTKSHHHRMSSGSADKDRDRISSSFMHSDGSSSTGSAVASSHDVLQSNANAKNPTDSPSTHSSSVQDGLYYRQRELQERLQQANSYAAADNLLRSAAAFDLRPPFPFMAGVPYSGAANGQIMPGCLQPGTAAAAAALHSQLNLLNVSHFDALRMRGLPGPAPGLDPFRGFMDSFNASGNRLPFTADALFRPPIDPMMLERERDQQQQLLQRLQQQFSHVPTSSNQSALAISQSSTVVGNGVNNPLASMIDSERAMNRTSVANSPCLPGLMPLTQFSTANNAAPQSLLTTMDSPAMAAFYSNLFQQRERMEADQRNRFLIGYNPGGGIMSLAPPQSAASMMQGALSPTANLDLLRMAMLNGGDPMLARTLAGFNPNGYASAMNQPNMNNHQLPAALNNVLTQGNKLNSPFSVTLQQMARRDSVLNSSTPHNNLQNR